MEKKTLGIAGTAAGLAAGGAWALVNALVPGFNPESDLARSLGSAEKRWAGVYTTHLSDGTITAELSNIALKSDAGDIDLSGYVTTDDARLTDARTPLAHAATHATGGNDALTPADIGAMATAPVGGKTYLAVGDSWVEYTPPEQTEDGTFDHTQLINRDAADQHPQSAITGLSGDLATIRGDIATKADASALSDYATSAALTSGLSGKADASHTHVVADVTGLQSALDAKANASALNDYATTAAMSAGLAVKADVSALADGLAGKASLAHTHGTSDVTGLDSALAAKAPLASPALTGTPTAPTASTSTSSTQIATTAYVKNNLAAHAPIPTASSGVGIVQNVSSSGTSYTIPSGGTWFYSIQAFGVVNTYLAHVESFSGIASGGSTVATDSVGIYKRGFVWRIQ